MKKFRKSIVAAVVFSLLCSSFAVGGVSFKAEVAQAASANTVDGWSTYTNFNRPDLTSIKDSSVNVGNKFTHKEWQGIDYTNNQGQYVRASEVYNINVKEASATSTSYVSYQSVDKAFIGARDYMKDASSYVQFLTGKDDSVTDWELVVVQNQDQAFGNDYRDFYKEDYNQRGDWKNDLTLPCSWPGQGFDRAIYANVTMIWQSDYDRNVTSPRCATNYNPVGLYRKTFKVDKGLADANGRINISFQGVEACYYVYINGQEVGYSEDTFSPHSFDITDYLYKNGDGSIDTDAENLLAVKVHKFCDGTWFEDQDMYYDGGIYRDVYLYATPLIHLEDYFVQTDLDSSYTDADIIMKDMTVSNYSTSSIPAGEYAIDVVLYNEDGSLFMNGYSIDIPALPAGSNGKASVTSVKETSHAVYEPKLWSCEQPNLYVMVLTLYNKKTGAHIESISQNLGFREIEFTRTEVDGNRNRVTNNYQKVTMNGQPFFFKGVNRHDSDPMYGKHVPHDVYMEDIKIMKQYNINSIRTSHYSNDEYLYYLCEKYGLYMMCETNNECHALMWSPPKEQLTAFRKMTLDRTNTTFERLKNRTANVMWSTGNECYYSGDGWYADGMFYDLIWYFKDHDYTRPVHCESSGASNGTDVDSQMYPYGIREVVNLGNVTMPYLMCEYDHGMGNAVGSLKEYWEAVRGAKNENILGGFIWDWVDQGRYKSVDDIIPSRLATGNRYDYYSEDFAHQNLYADENDGMFFTYGGDNGENPNDNSFCGNGLVSTDRSVQPELNEVKYQYQNFWFTKTTEFDIQDEWAVVYNESSFDNLDEYDVFIELYEDGTLLGSKKCDSVSVGPRETGDIRVDYKQFMPETITPGADYYLNILVKTKTALKGNLDGEEVELIPAGHVVSYEQFEIPETALEVTKTIALNDVYVDETDTAFEVSGDLFNFKIDKQTGKLKDYYYRDELVLTEGPTPNFWRAPINNDKYFDWAWRNVGKSAYVTNIETSVNDHNQNVIKTYLSFSNMGGIAAAFTYTIDGSGAVTVDIDYEIGGAHIDNKRLLRVGTDFVFPEGFENVYWLGEGGYETMIDRCSSAIEGAYSTTVDKMFYPYHETQDTGNVTGVKWFTLTDDYKKAAIAIAAVDDFEASALHFTADNLTDAKHPYDLEKKPEAYVSISKVSSGAGNASCGPDTLDEYRVYADRGNFDYSYTLVPYTATNAWGDMAGYVSKVTRQYRENASDYVYEMTSDPDLPDPRPTPTPVPPTVKPNTDNKVDTPDAPVAPKAPAKVKSVKAKKKAGKVVLTWKKVGASKGYVIERSMKKNKGFKKIAVINKKTVVKYVDKKVKKKKTYYYRVKAFKKGADGKIYGKASKVVKIKL